MRLLQTGYGLSDYPVVEEAVNDRITFISFCGIYMDRSVSDHSVRRIFEDHTYGTQKGLEK